VSASGDVLVILGVVAVGAAAVWYVEKQYEDAGGVVGLSSSLFTYATSSLANSPPPPPGMGSIPDQTVLNTSNATQEPWLNSLLNSSLTMQSIGM
jgi:hypothetical protein